VKQLPTLCLLTLLACAAGNAKVLVGIDTLKARNFPGLEGKRVGLITNPSGTDANGTSTLNILRHSRQVKLTALFGPEHGIHGTTKAGDAIHDQTDPKTGLPIYSLFGATRKPTPAMLRDIDTLIYDLQDIGVRSYTFISTLGLVMQAAGELGIEVYILDRPNPLGGLRIEGNGVDPDYNSFVGQYDIPYIYGLTPGELALWINDKWLAKPCKLKIFRMNGWTRHMTWQDTGLKWIPTSPNIPTAQAAAGYAATGLLGDIGISNGANATPHPFQIIAAENLDPAAMTRHFNTLGLPGITARPITFHPATGKYTGIKYTGIKLDIDPQARTSLLAINYRILDILRTITPQKNYFNRASADSIRMFDKINGGPANRQAWQAGKNSETITRTWKAKETNWKEERKPYLLYP
jgi:uncharacterized protein YbbC (DUF1343 family)